MPYLIADPALAEKELKFTAPQTLETMCQDLWNWQSRNPQGFDGPYIEGELSNLSPSAPDGKPRAP